MGESNSGCESGCTSTSWERVGQDLQGKAIARFNHENPAWRTTYQNDLLYRCTLCGSWRICQYWEYDTPETELEEFGVRNEKWIAVNEEQLAAIERALSSGVLLPHDYFGAGT